MQRPTALPLPSDHRLARLQSWLTLTIVWFAAHVLALIAPKAARRKLNYYAWATRILFVVRALRRLTLPRARPKRHTPSDAVIHRLTIRRIAGASFRRALHGRTLAERARALYAVLTNAEHWIARIMRRLRRRFTRLTRVRYASPRASWTAGALAGATPAPADTS